MTCQKAARPDGTEAKPVNNMKIIDLSSQYDSDEWNV